MTIKKKFNLADNEVQCWSPHTHVTGEVFCLEHLDAELITYQDSKQADICYKFYITYSHHCFTKDEHTTQAGQNSVSQYPSPKDRRAFHIGRYNLSKSLPQIIRTLPEQFVYHGGYDNYCSATFTDPQGNEIVYQIVFSVFRSQKKLRLHVESAYLLDKGLGKIKKVKFEKIAWALLRNKKLPRPAN
ncbi:heat-shock protein [Paraglaciecola sp.]|uniref:heat-shock protein n=1 Tax=Paraglaciecola sp. TaxID=1920173 RepID=UPI003267E3AB